MFDAKIFTAEMKKVANNVLEYYTAEEAWELYENYNIAIQGAWYQGLIDKETMQKTIAEFTMAAALLEMREKEEVPLYGYRPL